MKKILIYMNENHWYIIATIIGCTILLWLYGCTSHVPSMINPTQQITREELKAESDFLLAQIKNKLTELDRQDEVKKLIMDQAAIFGQTGTFNPVGLINTIVSIGAISFGLNRNQKVNDLLKNKNA